MSSSNIGLSELKKRANLAKKRLQTGYWQKLKEERCSLIKQVGTSVSAQLYISEMQKEKYNRDTYSVINHDKAKKDEEMYDKVCKILDSDEMITNPIGLLADEEELKRLDDGGRQRYILELSGKFRELKERYEREHNGVANNLR